MATESGLDLARWAVAAGWTNPADATIAVAVAMRAGSDPDAPGGLYGIGQGRDGPTQSAAAFQLWQSRNRDWDVFPPHQDGAWRLRLPAAAAAVAALPVAEAGKKASQAVTGVTETVGAVGDLAASAGRIAAFLTSDKAWERILKVGIGSGLILISVVYLVKRGTFDQGTRFLRKVGENADFIITARAATAPRGPTVTPPRATRRTRTVPAPRRASGRRAEPRPWSEYPTEPRPVVGVAKRTPKPLPGDPTPPRTGMYRRAKPRSERDAK